MQLENQTDELALLQEKAAASPESLSDIVALANAYAERGFWNEAIEKYKRAIELNPNDANLYNDLGTIYEELGEAKQGEDAYLTAIGLRPDHSTAYLNLGHLYEDQQRMPEAVHAFDKCLEFSPSTQERYEARHEILEILEHHADVIRPEEYGPEVVKLTADTITGQSRLAYQLAAAVLLANSLMVLIDMIINGSFTNFVFLIDVALAVGLLRLKAGARNFTIFRAAIGAFLWPITIFMNNDHATAVILSLMQWGYCGSLILLLTGQSTTRRLLVGVGIFVVFTLGIYALLLFALIFL
ncbi:MAG: tetratricopeptide repeat protein [Anaerolineae bacterium]|nr:tetratricopeptide repeat protein [Anaerolineae bacterium]